MATKTAAKKKTTTTRAKSSTTAKRPAAKKTTKQLPISLHKERNPQDHQVSGKYTFFYVLFACTTLIFAALAVRFFMISSDLLNKYEAIEVCARAGTCEVRVNSDSDEEVVEDIVEESTEEE